MSEGVAEGRDRGAAVSTESCGLERCDSGGKEDSLITRVVSKSGVSE